MDFLWSPWRYQYMATVGQETVCIFCAALATGDDASVGIVLRGRNVFVIQNKYPYTSGHVMIVPYAHEGELASCDSAVLAEIMTLVQRVQLALEEIYHPQGYNLGMNLGRAAGAGVIGHLHMHLLPRWAGDANFMTTIGETRVESESLAVGYKKLHEALHRQEASQDRTQGVKA
jgi:ATP adenylyltransferase